MAEFIPVTSLVSVAGQIDEADIARAAENGIRQIVSNRPDNEAPGQPTAETVATWAREAGMSFSHIPVGRDGISAEMLSDAATIYAAGEPTLAFCRSGTRSIILWALTEAAQGADVDELIEAAGQAGFDLAGYRERLLTMSPNTG